MKEILQSIFSGFNYIMSLPEHLIEPIEFLPEFFKDALIDSLNFVPFLFLIFVLIELLERYFTKKKHLFVFFMKKIGPLFGSLFASIPQCGFSVIASTLYTRRILSRGTLLAVYLATSDEAIPVLISDPTKVYLILPIIIIKVFIGIFAGYLVDLFVGYKANDPVAEDYCNHSHSHGSFESRRLRDAIRTKDFWIHPVKHTFNIFIFILIVSIILSYVITSAGTEETLAKYCLMNSPLQPVAAAIIGLIPNCAISVMFTLLFIKHSISFGSLIAGLSSAGGLGILVLLTKNNDRKDTAIIIGILVLVSSILGLILQYDVFHVSKLFSILGIQLS